MTSTPFVHLHLHSEYSLLDGMIHLEDLVDEAAKNNMPAVAITDHGNLFGAVKFSQKAGNKGIKPIIGCELYVSPRSRFDEDIVGTDGRRPYSHLIVLCEDEAGYKNLCQLSTLSYKEGFKYKPRVDKELLSRYSKGLISSSACLGGDVARKLRQGRFDEALKSASEFNDIFGKGNFYLELQEHGLPAQKEVNLGIIEIHNKTGIPLIATNDVHFLRKTDFEAHKILLCIQTKTTLEERNEKGKLAYTQEHYFKTKEEMWKLFGDVKDALDNTFRIAERCHFDFDLEAHHFPVFKLPEKYETYTLTEYFETVVREGYEEKIINPGKIAPDKIPVYQARLDEEVELIMKMGFISYFLIVWDFIKFAKENEIPVGPGRGSAAGSLVSYCLGITDIDPIYYNLLFERFLNPDRETMPDIDIDFCVRGRERVIQYVKELYGDENVSQIITFGELRSKLAIRDVGRVLNVPLAKVDKISKMIPIELGNTISIESAIRTILKDQYENDDDTKKILDFAKKIENLPRHAGMHAAGVVIAPEPIPNFCPLYKGTKGENTTQFAKDEIQALGLLKMDFLGLRTLTIIYDTLNLIRKGGRSAPHFKDIAMDDKETFELFSRGETDAVFQFESGGMKDALRRLKPNRFEQLIVLNALYRPGPLGAGILNDYIERSHHPEKTSYLLEDLKPILEETSGLIVYQEQVMQIANKIASFTLAEADILRQAISKKNVEKMKLLEDKFKKNALIKKLDSKIVEELIESIKHFGGYGFNKSHSAAYALVAYWTAFFKAHYPTEFMAATLSNFMDKTDEIMKYMNTCRESGISILPPDVNISDEDFSVEGSTIRYGLSAIKNVGTASVKAIMAARARAGKFKDLYQFSREVDHDCLSSRVIENLIQSGAMDSFGAPRWNLMEAIDTALKQGAKVQQDQRVGQTQLFDLTETGPEQVTYPEGKEWDNLETYHREKQSLGFYLSGHPLSEKKSLLKLLSSHSISEARHLRDTEPVAVGGVIVSSDSKKSKKKEAYGRFILEDIEARIEVLAFRDTYARYSQVIDKNKAVMVLGKSKPDNESNSIVADAVVLLDEAEEALRGYISSMEIAIPHTLCDSDLLASLKSVLGQFRGSIPVYFRVTEDEETDVVVSAGSKFSVNPGSEMKTAIGEIIGKDRLKYRFTIGSK
jgi:DNA polymerase III subunit alpha